MFLLKNKLLLWSSLVPVILSMQPVYAENNITKSEPIDIKAHYLLLDENKGTSIYKGAVLLTKGTLIIKADEITLYSDGKELTKALIIGSPADVQHQPENEEKVHSQAKTIEYFVTENRLELKGNAFVDQGERHFSGEYIEYDTRQRIITASGQQKGQISPENNSPKRRVHVIIGPNTDSNGNDASSTNSEK